MSVFRPIESACDRSYFPAAHSSGTRDLGDVIWIVLHDEEADTARSAAAWFKNPHSQGSAHICVDDNECFRSLPNEAIPWGAHGANEQGFHIEQAGYARWSAVIWKTHLNTLKRAAYKTALHCKLFGIPIRYVKADDLKRRQPGITTHREVTKAFGGSHTDPGLGFPIPLFLWLARRYRKQLG